MKTTILSLICILVSLQFLKAQPQSHDEHAHHQHNHNKKRSNLIENKGQWPKPVLFNASIDGGKICVQLNKILYHLQDYSSMHENHTQFGEGDLSTEIKEDLVHLNFVGSNGVNEIQKLDESSFYYNYFLGNDRSKWASKVHSYGTGIMKNIYNGIDLSVSNNEGVFKYEFLVSPYQSHDIIELNYAGQKSIQITTDGDLEITTSLGKIFEEHPYAYQLINGTKKINPIYRLKF